MIAIICPTRGRPEQFKRMVESCIATTTLPIIIYAVIQCDEDNKTYMVSGRNNVSVRIYRTNTDNCYVPTVHLWNKTCDMAMQDGNKFFMLGSDDMVFATSGWDKALAGGKIHVYALQDSRDPDGTPHPIVTREYIEAMGYFLVPIFVHWYVDSWTVEIARSNKCFTHLRDYMLVHRKPSDEGTSDETHNYIRRIGWSKRDAYVNDICGNYLESEKKRLGEQCHA